MTVAIVGRPNVGKSSLFNRLVGKRISIVHDEPGVTRDRIVENCTIEQSSFELVDTGGIGGGTDDALASQVELEAEVALEAADIILFVVDGRDGLSPIDETIARTLRRASAQVVLVINKIDSNQAQWPEAEFATLGFEKSIAVSAAHGVGFADLKKLLADAAGETAPGSTEKPTGELRIAMVGKPNAGKSSLINAILNEERTIVSDQAGTTRDAVDVPFSFRNRDYTLIDTAGIRKKNRRDSTVEVFSAMRTEKSIHRAHLCVLVVDSASGITAQDRKIARLILAANKPCIVALNKFDLYHPDAPFRERLSALAGDIGEELFFLHYSPMVAVSAKKREHLGKLFAAVEAVRKSSAEFPGTGELNRLLKDAMATAPPPANKGGKRLKLLYATLARTSGESPLPVPRFVLFVNKRAYLADSYRRYLERKLREQYELDGLPIIFDIRERAGKQPA